MPDTPLGRFAWYELLTADPEASRTFYTAVLGWGSQEWDGGGGAYTMFLDGETPIGGITPLSDVPDPEVPPTWLAYVSTPDIEDTLARAVSLGGSPEWDPTHVPGVGRLGGFRDPHGAGMAVLEPEGDTPGRDAPATPGRMSWHELMTPDWKSAFDFYSELFGWKEAGKEDLGPEYGTYAMFSNGDHPLGAMFTPPELPASSWIYYVSVADLDASLDKVRAHGGEVVNGPMEVPGGDRVAQCRDDQGVMFALHEAAA